MGKNCKFKTKITVQASRRLHRFISQQTVINDTFTTIMTSSTNIVLISLLVVLVIMTSSIESRRMKSVARSSHHGSRGGGIDMRKRMLRICSSSCERYAITRSYVKSCQESRNPAICGYCRLVYCKIGRKFL